MKGPKIENIRDPKWVGKKIVMGEFSVSPDKLIFVGNGQICTQNRFNTLSLWPIDCYDWHEWIEPEEEKKPEFPFKVGDRIRNKEWRDVQCQYIELINISESGFAFSTYPEPDHYFKWCSEAIRIDIQKDPSNWEIYTPPKKKKTYSMALLKFKEYETRPFELLGPYSSKEDISTKNYDVLQFPAVTKDGTVLELEVDDDS